VCCGNGVVDAALGEECEDDSDCAGGEVCVNCDCVTPTPTPTPTPTSTPTPTPDPNSCVGFCGGSSPNCACDFGPFGCVFFQDCCSDFNAVCECD